MFKHLTAREKSLKKVCGNTTDVNVKYSVVVFLGQPAVHNNHVTLATLHDYVYMNAKPDRNAFMIHGVFIRGSSDVAALLLTGRDDIIFQHG